MKIEHVAIWTLDLERLKNFYCRYFSATAGPKYHNPRHGFNSYFLQFDNGARLELMQMPSVSVRAGVPGERLLGWAHLAFSLGSRQLVDDTTLLLRRDGFQHLDGPRETGDGYYESTVLDPDGNRLELTV